MVTKTQISHFSPLRKDLTFVINQSARRTGQNRTCRVFDIKIASYANNRSQIIICGKLSYLIVFCILKFGLKFDRIKEETNCFLTALFSVTFSTYDAISI